MSLLLNREPVAVGATYDEPPQREQRELREETAIVRFVPSRKRPYYRAFCDNKGLMAIIAGVVVVIMLVWLLLRGSGHQQQEALAGTVSIAANTWGDNTSGYHRRPDSHDVIIGASTPID